MNLRRYVIALLLTASVTLVLWLTRDVLTPANISLIYLLVVLMTAIYYSVRASLLVTVLSFLCFNFFLVKPYYTFIVSDPREVLDLFIFFACALLTGRLAAQARKQAEKFQRAKMFEESDRLKTALLHAVSHDLRTPITIIKTSTHNLLELHGAIPEAERVEMLHIIERESDSLNGMVGNLLDFSRLKAGALRIKRDLNSLEEIAGDVALEVYRRTQVVRIKICFPEDMPLVRFDYGLLLQALSNIVNNTVRYEPDSGMVEISGEADQRWAKVRVANHGPNIAPDVREQIMEPFYHGEDGNIGLGLAIAKGIIETHGGKLWVEDTPGGGATFTFILPLTTPRERKEADKEIDVENINR